MALSSFGGVNDQCGVTSWAEQETGMLPLLSCDSDMTAWDLETTICNLRYCRLKLFVYGWLIPMLISWVLRKSTKHSSNLSKKKTSTIRITWRLFFVCSSCLFTLSLSCAHAYYAMDNSVTGFHYLPFSSKIFANMLQLSFSMKLTFSGRKCH